MAATPFPTVDTCTGEFRGAHLEPWAILPDGLRERDTTVVGHPATQATQLAALAVQALLDEVNLTPKPGLVDRRGSGAHTDLTLALMHRSAHSLFPCFKAMAEVAVGMWPGVELRERLAAIGRNGEMAMFAATGGCNTHKGAIWALGLLVAGAVISTDPTDLREIATLAGTIARFPDRMTPNAATHGIKARQQYGVNGARGEAQEGFPHVVNVGLPTLHDTRLRGVDETYARLDALIAVMSRLDDTCLLHRGGLPMLSVVKDGAREVLREGGASTIAGMKQLIQLDATLLEINASPGGSGDLLAATLFLDSLNALSQQASFLQNRGAKLWKR
jgi:triphosphoribosyl-dephospho-CoA synthase